MSPVDLTTRLSGLLEPLRDWMPRQRWFAGKNRPVHGIRLLHATELLAGDPGMVHTVLAVDQGGPDEDYYQILLGHCRERHDLQVDATLVEVGEVGGEVWYSAVHDPQLSSHLLDLMAANTKVDHLHFAPEPGVTLESGLRGRPVGAEQSNTSLVFGQEYIFKLFSRLHPGPTRDLELPRALHSVGCPHVAEPLAALYGEVAGQQVVLGVLQRFLPSAVEGWAMATTSVRDLMAEADLYAGEVGGDFAAEAYRLGQAVGVVHADLRRALGFENADATRIDAAADAMHRRLDTVVAMVPELGEHEAALRAAFDAVRTVPAPVPIQHIHGDLHLGQVLRDVTGWVLIDFEGEPAAPPAERLALRSPLRDVAGMLRSFDYAAHQLLVGRQGEHQLEVRAQEWAARNSAAFCEGYAAEAGDPREHAALLRGLELDKAVYEVAYEHANRPDWLAVPLGAIARITAGEDDT